MIIEMEVVQLKKVLGILCVSSALLLAACSEDEKTLKTQPDVSIETIKINEENELTIVPLYTQYQQYLNASLESTDSEESKQNFKKYVLDYIGEVGEEEKIDTSRLKTDFNLKSTPHKQQLLKQLDKLIEQHEEIKEIIASTYADSNQILPKKKSTVFIAPYNPEFFYDSEPLKGVGAAAYKDAFILFLDTDFDKDVLAYSTAHEYHHLILRDQNKYNLSSILESIIIEGKADAFADRIVKGVSPPWHVQLDDATMEHIASRVNDYETSFTDFVVGNSQKDIPRWSNYILGKDVLHDYLTAHPELSIPEWTFKEGHEILEEYKYRNVVELEN
ncbi:DUF2268 domain-containing protein [Exiguobacterium sp. MER 193]|uniref:DUF2268 domain-containing protein n=1 Tax=unclassified Exiguobacterium TaxID=2644629 RepID=UPI002036693D|nr:MULTISPECIES: DUF2268 domain-containing putative Zn-dependent protease [unclassified Exiguobacterium]MCM3279163.1 DUF2268 domain-containing protein [Exiguobacterium sp. MER 193]